MTQLTAATNPADAGAVRMIREVLDVFVREPQHFSETDAKFIASMHQRTRTLTDGTLVYTGATLPWIRHLHARFVK